MFDAVKYTPQLDIDSLEETGSDPINSTRWYNVVLMLDQRRKS